MRIGGLTCATSSPGGHAATSALCQSRSSNPGQSQPDRSNRASNISPTANNELKIGPREIRHCDQRQARLSGNTRIWQILVSASSPQDLPAAQQEVAEIMRESHHIADGDDDDFTVRNQTEIANAAQGTTKIMTWLLASISQLG